MPPDGHIRLLPNHVANKIAAGEVVERPASVLKELLENALDAGATRIDVTVTAGGRTLVSVRDNGCGMNREDALLSLERHATSKIRDVDDIERISTLGFRGEAIPSIASVSRFTLTTRRADAEEGTRVVVNAGTLAEVKTCGAPPGTCIEVRDLFCNVPARRKFLRAFVTEEGHVRATFTVHALAHPDVGFSLTLDGREVYRLPPGATLEERIRALFGAPFAESLVPVISDVGSVHVHGYAERPGHDAALRRDQFVFVNGRPATAASITYALREAYPRQRAEARPAVVLFIDLPPEQVDVNVHPSKREVRFRRAADVRDALLAAFAPQRAEREAPAPPATPAPESADNAPQPFVAPFQPALPTSGGTSFSSSASPLSTQPDPAVALKRNPPALEPAMESPREEPPLQTATGPWRWFKFLAQTGSGWVLLETDAGLVTLNPRAARERIAYERIIDAHEALTQPLLIPHVAALRIRAHPQFPLGTAGRGLRRGGVRARHVESRRRASPSGRMRRARPARLDRLRHRGSRLVARRCALARRARGPQRGPVVFPRQPPAHARCGHSARGGTRAHTHAVRLPARTPHHGVHLQRRTFAQV